MADDVIRVDGLKEAVSTLRQAGKDLPRAVADADRKVAKLVVDAARPKLTTKYGKVARSRLSASGTQSGAFAKLTGPTAFGDEFGAKRYTQFKPHLGREGYAVYPTIREKTPEIEHMYLEAVDEAVTRRAFPD